MNNKQQKYANNSEKNFNQNVAQSMTQNNIKFKKFSKTNNILKKTEQKKNINEVKKKPETKPQHNSESISIKDKVDSLQPLFDFIAKTTSHMNDSECCIINSDVLNEVFNKNNIQFCDLDFDEFDDNIFKAQSDLSHYAQCNLSEDSQALYLSLGDKEYANGDCCDIDCVIFIDERNGDINISTTNNTIEQILKNHPLPHECQKTYKEQNKYNTQQQNNLTSITEEDIQKISSEDQSNNKPIYPSPSGQPLIGHQNYNNSLTVDSLKDYCDKVNTIIKQHPSSTINMNVIDDDGKTLKLQLELGNEFVISNDQQMVYIFGENNYLACVLLIDNCNPRIFRKYKNIHRLTQEHPLPIGKYGQKGNKTTYANLFLKRKYMAQQNNKNNKQINNQQGKSYRKKNNINK